MRRIICLKYLCRIKDNDMSTEFMMQGIVYNMGLYIFHGPYINNGNMAHEDGGEYSHRYNGTYFMESIILYLIGLE